MTGPRNSTTVHRVLSVVGECVCGARRFEDAMDRRTFREAHAPTCAIPDVQTAEERRAADALARLDATLAGGRESAALPRPGPALPGGASDDLQARARQEWEEEQRAEASFDVPGADEAHAERVLYGEDLA